MIDTVAEPDLRAGKCKACGERVYIQAGARAPDLCERDALWRPVVGQVVYDDSGWRGVVHSIDRVNDLFTIEARGTRRVLPGWVVQEVQARRINADGGAPYR